mgnify:CR=1 FL=1
MTPPQHIYLNGVLLDGRQETLSAQRLLQDNYVHAAVNTSAHSPLYLEKHLAYAAESYRKLYGTVPQFDTMQLREGIAALLDADRMPRLGNIVRIYLLPSQRSGDAVPDLLAMADHSTIYRGYELISIRPKAILTNYEIPFCGHRTAVSLTTSRYMQAFAEHTGCHVALHCNRAERLISCLAACLLGSQVLLLRDSRAVINKTSARPASFHAQCLGKRLISLCRPRPKLMIDMHRI